VPVLRDVARTFHRRSAAERPALIPVAAQA
jgi:hypothetical protein